MPRRNQLKPVKGEIGSGKSSQINLMTIRARLLSKPTIVVSKPPDPEFWLEAEESVYKPRTEAGA